MKAFKKILIFNNRFSFRSGLQKLLIPVFIGCLLACNTGQRPDVRPGDQQSFIRVVKELRDLADQSPLTDPNRPVMIDQGVKRLKSYIAETMKSQFKDWDARVLDNAKTDPNGTEVRIALGMSIDDFNLEETARFKSVVFRESLSDALPALRQKLQTLNVGDHVKISGSFVSRDKKIDVDPYNEKEYKLSKNIFSNPEFRVEITDIRLAED